MISETTLAVTARDSFGSNASRRLRREGSVPVSVYAGGAPAQSFAVNARQLGAILRSEETRNSIFYLAVSESEKTPVRVKALQLDPVRGTVLHADLMQVDLNKPIVATVPLHLVGDAEGVKAGGTLEHGVRDIQVKCLPKDIPTHFDVSVTNLKLGEYIYVGDLKLPEGVTLVSDAKRPAAYIPTKG